MKDPTSVETGAKEIVKPQQSVGNSHQPASVIALSTFVAGVSEPSVVSEHGH